MIDYSQLSAAYKAGAQAQEYYIRKQMWNNIETLKTDVKKLSDEINYIQKFLKRVFP